MKTTLASALGLGLFAAPVVASPQGGNVVASLGINGAFACGYITDDVRQEALTEWSRIVIAPIWPQYDQEIQAGANKAATQFAADRKTFCTIVITPGTVDSIKQMAQYAQ